jgi:hypothetical protein
MADKDYVIVENRTAAKVVYSIPDKGIRRELAPGQAIKTTKDEIEALSYVGGGLDLIRNHLLVKDEEMLDNLGVEREAEYYMSANDVLKLLKEGTLDEFLDALDFAPEGVITLIQDLSVQLPLNDYAKRQALKDKTGFDVSAAIENYKANTAPEEGEEAKPVEKKTRRVQPKTVRRTEPKVEGAPKKIIKK